MNKLRPVGAGCYRCFIRIGVSQCVSFAGRGIQYGRRWKQVGPVALDKTHGRRTDRNNQIGRTARKELDDVFAQMVIIDGVAVSFREERDFVEVDGVGPLLHELPDNWLVVPINAPG